MEGYNIDFLVMNSFECAAFSVQTGMDLVMTLLKVTLRSSVLEVFRFVYD